MIRDLALRPGRVIYLSTSTSTPSSPTSFPRPFASSSPSPSPPAKQLFTFNPSFTFYPYTMSLLQEALLSHLKNSSNSDTDRGGKVDEQTIIDVLEEFAWASIAAGKRVREYCEDLSEVLTRVSYALPFSQGEDPKLTTNKAHQPSTVHRLIHGGTLSILFPFIHIASPYFTSSSPFPPPLIPAPSLATVGRKQLIDALAKLSRQRHLPRDALYTEGLIFEVVLEYIGRKWRTEQGQVDVVELIGRKLTEVEFEVSSRLALPYLYPAWFFRGDVLTHIP